MKNYDNFFLPVNDLKKAKEFYQGILGLPTKFDFSDKGFLAFKIGEQEPAIILKDISEPYQINTGLAVEFDDPFGNRLGITDYR